MKDFNLKYSLSVKTIGIEKGDLQVKTTLSRDWIVKDSILNTLIIK